MIEVKKWKRQFPWPQRNCELTLAEQEWRRLGAEIQVETFNAAPAVLDSGHLRDLSVEYCPDEEDTETLQRGTGETVRPLYELFPRR